MNCQQQQVSSSSALILSAAAAAGQPALPTFRTEFSSEPAVATPAEAAAAPGLIAGPCFADGGGLTQQISNPVGLCQHWHKSSSRRSVAAPDCPLKEAIEAVAAVRHATSDFEGMSARAWLGSVESASQGKATLPALVGCDVLLISGAIGP